MSIKIKPLIAAIAAISFATPVIAADDNAVTTATNSKKAVETAAAAKSTDNSNTIAQQTTPATPRTYVMKTMPMNANVPASWRFGVWRSWKSGRRWHNGIDISGSVSGGRRITYPANGTITQKEPRIGATRVRRENLPDSYLFMHQNVLPEEPKGSPVFAGKSAGQMGNKATGDVHLHFEYYVPCKSGRVRFVGMTGTRTGSFATFDDKMKRLQQHGAIYKGSQSTETGYCVTDPAPYLPSDRTYNPTMNDKALEAYLGNSIRSQYNALYNPMPNLPLGAGARAATKRPPNLPQYGDILTPDQLAALKAGGIGGAIFGEGAGYSLNGELMSYQMLSSFISATDGQEWASLPKPPKSTSLADMTPKEIITQISTQRFGNADWEKAIIGLSSKGLLTEFLMMEAEGNFLEQQNSQLKSRVEFLIAGLTQAQLFEYNKKIEAMSIIANAAAVPQILDVELRPMYGYGYEEGSMSLQNPPQSWEQVNKDDLNSLFDYLLQAVAHGESSSYDAFNYGTIGKKSCPGFGKTDRARREDDKQGRSYVTNSTLGYLQDNRKTKVGCPPDRFAVGKFQFIPDTYGDYMRAMGVSKARTLVFNEGQQLHAVRWRMLKSQRHALKSFILNGDRTIYAAALDLHNEWRSIGRPIKGVPPERWVATDGVNKANKDSNIMVVQALIGIANWHKKYGHLGKVTLKPDFSLNIPAGAGRQVSGEDMGGNGVLKPTA